MTIQICMGSSCFSRGNGENLRVLNQLLDKHRLGVLVRPMGHLCEGKCSEGPNIMIDGRMFHCVTPDMLRALMEDRLGAAE
ncbi:MAG TPA: (2Fe-2S) ferredoxin domain-containing protein [Bryobacteraceae bacterium]|nr:(2Fe-2S) ferredoxin domain-containing protein [Bryobacteraceae bacterium]